MPFCTNCGTPIENLDDTCPFCGNDPKSLGTYATKGEAPKAEQPAAPPAPTVTPTVTPPPEKPRMLSIPHLLFSIFNTIFCCFPFGIAGIFLTVMAKEDSRSKESERSLLKIALILNAVGTALVALLFLVYIVMILGLGL